MSTFMSKRRWLRRAYVAVTEGIVLTTVSRPHSTGGREADTWGDDCGLTAAVNAIAPVG